MVGKSVVVVQGVWWCKKFGGARNVGVQRVWGAMSVVVQRVWESQECRPTLQTIGARNNTNIGVVKRAK